ncbi:carbamoyl phosphate synthase-like protein [Methylophaga lonarensis MPL]|uniref:Carbamoyl phosphate synthase-like protein n=1 Tax=Methylophaga lonarensis MPL TaxID=1286106 RepID=M7NZ42_9GAMM|nr:ATP-grasp domain-containing protein [Methylophaga lonarensis]EMR14103.1 carbamoyl phosphate synthase-like protein [Methylophaga lonarensis MPL]
MNVLLTSVGRRSYLVNYFKTALDGKGQVIGANMYSNTAGMFAADIAVVTPPANHSEYTPFLAEVCQKYDVGLLCSLHDLDVYMLSQDQQWLSDAGIAHTIPTAEWGRISLDKYESTNLLEQKGIPVPKTTISLSSAFEAIHNDEMTFPLIVKARAGFGSLGLAICNNVMELKSAYNAAVKQTMASGGNQYISLPEDELVLIQQAISGREVCLGVLNDLNGVYCAHFSCEVHSMRSGESDWATSLDREPYTVIARAFSELTAHRGIWGLDFLEEDGVYKAIDINPRFTGDYPFHHLAGANVPAALIAWASGREAAGNCFHSKSGITGFKDLVPMIAKSRSSGHV